MAQTVWYLFYERAVTRGMVGCGFQLMLLAASIYFVSALGFAAQRFRRSGPQSSAGRLPVCSRAREGGFHRPSCETRVQWDSLAAFWT